ncbi:uncharacterized protein LOC112906644 [Agrilus planipennis]|uniref:Uncharacterized protein LOC108734603 n=1 Tax=Agrilus planipennis TaxID=224129 RepID=A0A1W4WCN6_AGRPL|nr:uncharacterized protein LOC108734603 [Agrilus planipennis]XP_025836958.1 uncharacterized protein LOC112906644 [Agrilus planipennis]
MNCSLFLSQVQILMHAQQIKLNEADPNDDKNMYNWLRNKKYDLTWISLRHEFLIRQALTKISSDQQTAVIKELVNYTESNENLDPSRIPEICLDILNKTITSEIVQTESLRRASTFRRSIRMSIRSNRVSPSTLMMRTDQNNEKKSVTFCENPKIYSIYN